jgi:4-hydroxy-4-methyl-2-oxoglutarate aldolase
LTPVPEHDAWLELGAATVGESGGRPMAARVKAVWAGAGVVGPAFVASCAGGDNLAIHVAAAEAPAGSVLVVAVDGQPELGYWGEVLTTGAQARGIAGLVIDACVRDVDALERLAFPVFSVGIALPGAAKVGPGAVGGTAVVGGVEVATGDLVVADRDGVAVVPAAAYDAVLAAARERAANEQGLFRDLRAGATTVELLGLDTTTINRLS